MTSAYKWYPPSPLSFVAPRLRFGEVVPLVAVPTTSGTGSEVAQTAVVTHEGVKRGISGERLRPSFALVDPALAYDLPRA